MHSQCLWSRRKPVSHCWLLQPLATGRTALQSLLTIAIALVEMQHRAGVPVRSKVASTQSLSTCGRQTLCGRTGATCEAGKGSRCPNCMTPVPAADVTHRRLGDAFMCLPNNRCPSKGLPEATYASANESKHRTSTSASSYKSTRRHPGGPQPVCFTPLACFEVSAASDARVATGATPPFLPSAPPRFCCR